MVCRLNQASGAATIALGIALALAGDNEPADLGAAVPRLDFLGRIDVQTEFAQDLPRFASSSRAELRILVPIRWQAETRPRIVRAQSANDETCAPPACSGNQGGAAATNTPDYPRTGTLVEAS